MERSRASNRGGSGAACGPRSAGGTRSGSPAGIVCQAPSDVQPALPRRVCGRRAADVTSLHTPALITVVDDAVSGLFSEVVREHALDRTAPQLVAAVQAYLQRPAKRLRPTLLMAAARAFEAPHGEAVLRLAAATELLHLFALMHDDLLDQDMRVAASSSAVRVLGGDLLFVIGYRTIVRVVAGAGLPGEIVDTVNHAAITTLAGQAMELHFAEDPDQAPTLERLFELYDRKTGWYTFVAPLQIGALCGGAGVHDRDLLAAAGRKLGHAFQLRDDAADIGTFLEAGITTSGRPGERAGAPPWEFNLARVVAHETTTPIDRLTAGDIAGFARYHADSARGEAVRLLTGLSVPAARVAELSQEACRSVDDDALRSVF
ncbi:MAG: hypothetical protein EA403_04455 [Spirochaetaceae bacterium]|nr:MAG: hypothetical protein EA403_04455 [Spirochaetaceae bacterium]